MICKPTVKFSCVQTQVATVSTRIMHESTHTFLKGILQLIKNVEEILIVNILILGIFLISTQKSLIKKIKDLTVTTALCIVETVEATSKQVKFFHVLFENVGAHMGHSEKYGKFA